MKRYRFTMEVVFSVPEDQFIDLCPVDELGDVDCECGECDQYFSERLEAYLFVPGFAAELERRKSGESKTEYMRSTISLEDE